MTESKLLTLQCAALGKDIKRWEFARLQQLHRRGSTFARFHQLEFPLLNKLLHPSLSTRKASSDAGCTHDHVT